MSTKAQARLEAMEAEREMLGNLASINGAVQGLANVVEFENQHFAERIQRVEVQLSQLSQLYSVVRKIVEHLDAQQDPGDWWKTGRNGDGGGP